MARKSSQKKSRPSSTRKTRKEARIAQTLSHNASVEGITKRLGSSTPFADTGGTIGGSMFGPIGKSVGRWLGQGVGMLFGSGDYKVSSPVDYNVLYNSNQIPKFASNKFANMVCHREYIGDVTGSSSFQLQSYPLNPGVDSTFPWLSTVAQNYEEYKFHGLVFEFRTTSSEYNTSTAALGAVILATQYNASSANFTSKQQMENYDYAVSAKPSLSIMHGVECARSTNVVNELYVRTGSVPYGQDIRLYDLGEFQLATAGMSTSYDVGELWVSYCVELLKPKVPSTLGGVVGTGHIGRSSFSNTNPLGSIGIFAVGNLNPSCTSTVLSWTANINTRYMVTFDWVGGTAVTAVAPVPSSSTLTFVNGWQDNSFGSGGVNTAPAPFGGTNNTTQLHQAVVAQATIEGTVSLTMPTTGTLPTSPTQLDIYIFEIDSSVSI